MSSLCRGPGCEDVWPAGRALVMQPFEAAVARVATASFDLSGTVDHGAAWSLAPFGERLYVGMPESGRVVRWTPGQDGSDVDELSTWRGVLPELGAVVIAIDPNNNGLPTLIASAPGADLDAGAVVIWTGAREGSRVSQATVVLRGASASERLGEAMAWCPDLTGDGVGDLFVAAPAYSTPPTPVRGGRVFLVPSQLEQVGSLPFSAWSEGAISWHADAPSSALGASLACGEDLTGDGVADLVIGAPAYGEARGGAVWVLDGANLPAPGALEAPTVQGTSGSAWLGTSLAVGDLDGDGIGDLAVGASGAAGGAGEVAVFYGPDMLLARTIIEPTSQEDLAHLGRSVLIADLDGDGYDELIVGAEDYTDGEDFDAGWVGVWRGGPSRLGPNLVLGEDEDWSLRPDHAYQRLGGRLAVHPDGLVLGVGSRGF